ncbi:hypothetical protein OKW43_005728 [Paraburkholderia sp. WC7.3g]|uniref:Roadblock/LC7 domain-containing protein n=1 Tax=Paraburkholderia podalyriae TaxID=1938811 RepID=A0ABR7Q1M1_9BURK|nr:hypothetical protein [Paraburkholderia podalyriae]MBC8752388.1 hypothetical protein [Paraburkholderia podalyriae]
MANSTVSGHATQEHTPASLQVLADYLELALDDGESVVVMRDGTSVRSVYIGNPTGSLDDLVEHGTVAAYLAGEMLALTEAGVNRMTANGETYRFTRSVRYIADRQVVVFAPT